MRVTPELRAALARVDEVFPRKLPPVAALCVDCVRQDSAPMDALVREHRAHRLTLPVAELFDLSFGHGSALVHRSLRRFAWFVPAIFSAALDGGGFGAMLSAAADLGEEARATSKEELSTEEKGAATGFLVAAVRAVLGDERFDLYDLATVFAAASGLGLDAAPIVEAWLALPGADMAVARVLAAEWITAEGEPMSLEEQIGRLTVKSSVPRFDHLVDPQHALVRALATEHVRAWIEQKCLAETDPERQELLSAVEQRIRAERARS